MLSDVLKPVFSPGKVFLHFQIVVAAQGDYSEVENDGLALLHYAENSKENQLPLYRKHQHLTVKMTWKIAGNPKMNP